MRRKGVLALIPELHLRIIPGRSPETEAAQVERRLELFRECNFRITGARLGRRDLPLLSPGACGKPGSQRVALQR
jgi:hypothetical protein